jgi:putative cell wall-binding protein
MATAAAVAMIGSTLAISSAAFAGPGTTAATTDRASGVNRNATAVDAAESIAGNLAAAPTEITIVNGLDFPDGLAAAGLSIAGAAPTLLATVDAIPAETVAYITALQAVANGTPNITVVGGLSSVSSAVYEELDDLNGAGTIVRYHGISRYETALAVATATRGAGTSVVLTTGLSAADALSAGPFAIAADSPIILNDGDSLRTEVRAWLVAEGITDVTIIGGTSAVSASVESELTDDLGITVVRLNGVNRDDTAAKIATAIDALGGGVTDVVLVNRSGYADALAAGPFTDSIGGAASIDAAILTVGVDSLPAETAAFLAANCDTIVTVTAVGGTSVISAEVLAAAAAATACTVPAISTAALTITKTTQRVMVIGDTIGGGNTPDRSATSPTLTSILGSAASGPAAANYEVTFVAAVGTPSAVIDTTVNPVLITYTDNFASLTRAQFVTNWNASIAGALFVADAGTGLDTFTVAPDDTSGAASVGTLSALGSYDATLVVTFDQAVNRSTATPTVTPEGEVNNNSSTVLGNTVVLLGIAGAGATTPATLVATTGTTTVTQTWADQTTAVPTASATVRYSIGSVSNLANGQDNVALLMSTITVN